ncbi:DUF397 domain-containing protein [Actinokineospora guangxiensis]|uniref:DUF397 domain-containing protein n=1 Tax=Actinokineospora guangxiensis TaxID=1490288 RepID=A0ABW0EVR7_9PSEU
MSDIEWIKSSRCGDGATCVEVAFPEPGIAVRDAKSPVAEIAFGGSAWRVFLGAVSRAELR